MKIIQDDLTGTTIIDLLTRHVDYMRAISPPGSSHALGLDGLQHSDLSFWSAWQDEELLGCGALKRLDNRHGEIKSMHTVEQNRGKGTAAAMLEHIMAEARRRGYCRLSLETGSFEAFTPARTLYAKYGFQECSPFSGYKLDPNSVFMTLVI